MYPIIFILFILKRVYNIIQEMSIFYVTLL